MGLLGSISAVRWILGSPHYRHSKSMLTRQLQLAEVEPHGT